MIALVTFAMLSAPPQAPVKVDVHGDFWTLGHIRSDSDFDPTERFYDPDGQTEGQVATLLKPELSLSVPSARVRVVYEAELGWNAWSRNAAGAPNQFVASEQQGLSMRHRQLYASWSPSNAWDIRAGYQHFDDPSGLFLSHEWAAGAVTLGLGSARLRLLLGQLPDSTFEGVSVREDNFSSDSLFGALFGQFEAGPVVIDAGLVGVGDLSVIDRPLVFTTVLVGVRMPARRTGIEVWAHGLVQLGTWTGSGVGGIDQTLFAWAAQAGAKQQLGSFSWGLNAFVLSADDAHDGSEHWGGFLGSGRNRSATHLLTEDEYRDRHDNLDERLAVPRGAFFENRAGLFVVDATVGLKLTDWYEPRVVVGAALALESENALGESFVGLEVGVHNTFAIGDHVRAFAAFDLLLPGGAAAAFVNDVDRTATATQYGGRLGVGVLY